MRTLLSMLAAAIGLAVVVAWIVPIPWLTNIRSDWATMKMTTAVLFVLAGTGVALTKHWKDGAVAAGFVVFLAAFAALFGGPLLRSGDAGIGSLQPDMPSLMTLAMFIMVGGYAMVEHEMLHPLRFHCGGFVVGVSCIAVLGYTIGEPLMYYRTPHSGAMAFHTAIGFVLLGLAIVWPPKIGENA